MAKEINMYKAPAIFAASAFAVSVLGTVASAVCICLFPALINVLLPLGLAALTLDFFSGLAMSKQFSKARIVDARFDEYRKVRENAEKLAKECQENPAEIELAQKRAAEKRKERIREDFSVFEPALKDFARTIGKEFAIAYNDAKTSPTLKPLDKAAPVAA
jgi:hypothetical protein